MLKFKSCILFLVLFSGYSTAQRSDTLLAKRPHSPKKATILSAVLPGAGQLYNKKWWKVPIIYGGFAGLGYAFVFNQDQYDLYRDAYLLRVDDDPNSIDEFDGVYSDANLIELQDYYRRNRDLSIIGGVLLYVMNIIDANVDAHLFHFDVGEDLSMNVQPTNLGLGFRGTSIPGVSIALRLK